MKPKKETDVQDIKETEITKYYAVGGKTICFRFQNVFTGMVDGKKELLDEVLINNMVGQMAKVIKSNCSRYNPIPEEIIIGSRGSREISNKENQEKPKEEEKDLSFIFKDLEERMKQVMGTKVIINKKDRNKGRIEIEYYSEAELERIVELIESIK